MKKFITLATVLAGLSLQVFAQKVEVDKKTGLVTVDDKEAFYLTPKNKSFMQSDYALENLNHEELAYLKYEEVVRYNSRGQKSTSDYLMVFTQSGNQCYLADFSVLTGVLKPMAKSIAGANLVKDGKMAPNEEKKFLLLHNGTFANETAAPPPAQPERTIVVQESKPANVAPADISLKENNIYNNSEMVGTFKRTVDNGVSTISVYNTSDVMVCKASHQDGNENADWNIQADGKSVSILYNGTAPLEKLCKYLVEKGIL